MMKNIQRKQMIFFPMFCVLVAHWLLYSANVRVFFRTHGLQVLKKW